jgi:hypothetical protein
MSNVFKMAQGAGIKFWVKLKKTATEMSELLKMRTVKNVYPEQMDLKGVKGSKKGESRYKTMKGKAVFQLVKQRNRRKSVKSVWPKIEL